MNTEKANNLRNILFFLQYVEKQIDYYMLNTNMYL